MLAAWIKSVGFSRVVSLSTLPIHARREAQLATLVESAPLHRPFVDGRALPRADLASCICPVRAPTIGGATQF